MRPCRGSRVEMINEVQTDVEEGERCHDCGRRLGSMNCEICPPVFPSFFEA